jgi:hypothetical protein
VADSGKIRNELGWQPRYENLETIIETGLGLASEGSSAKQTLEPVSKTVSHPLTGASRVARME